MDADGLVVRRQYQVGAVRGEAGPRHVPGWYCMGQHVECTTPALESDGGRSCVCMYISISIYVYIDI